MPIANKTYKSATSFQEVSHERFHKIKQMIANSITAIAISLILFFVIMISIVKLLCRIGF